MAVGTRRIRNPESSVDGAFGIRKISFLGNGVPSPAKKNTPRVRFISFASYTDLPWRGVANKMLSAIPVDTAVAAMWGFLV